MTDMAHRKKVLRLAGRKQKHHQPDLAIVHQWHGSTMICSQEIPATEPYPETLGVVFPGLAVAVSKENSLSIKPW